MKGLQRKWSGEQKVRAAGGELQLFICEKEGTILSIERIEKDNSMCCFHISVLPRLQEDSRLQDCHVSLCLSKCSSLHSEYRDSFYCSFPSFGSAFSPSLNPLFGVCLSLKSSICLFHSSRFGNEKTCKRQRKKEQTGEKDKGRTSQ